MSNRTRSPKRFRVNAKATMHRGNHRARFSETPHRFSTPDLTCSLPPPTCTKKQNAELFTLTYGALVMQVMRDCEDCVEEVNKRLDKMGVSIGSRLIEDFLAKTNTTQRCASFKETCEVVALVGLKMFLGLTCVVTNWSSENTECDILFEHLNPFCEFVELPDRFVQDDLKYCQLLCGVVRGALLAIGTKTECEFVSDKLKGDETFVMHMKFLGNVEDEYPFED